MRWCSPALKIDVLAAAIRNQPRFLDGRTLVITGERAEESPSRARYAAIERHRTAAATRAVDHWRLVQDWTEAQVWDAIGATGIRPHPAYVLGWGRLSCRTCIFGSRDQWATVRAVFPAAFRRVQVREATAERTIHRSLDIAQLADHGTAFTAATLRPDELAQAEDTAWRLRSWRSHGRCRPVPLAMVPDQADASAPAVRERRGIGFALCAVRLIGRRLPPHAARAARSQETCHGRQSFPAISIGGSLDRDKLLDLAAIVNAEGLSTDWDGEDFTLSQLPSDAALTLMAHEVVWRRFETLEEFCVAEGLPFARWSGSYAGCAGMSNIGGTWRRSRVPVQRGI